MKLQVDGKALDLKAALKNFFGFNEFRGLQEEVIKSVLNKENTFVIMPTGGGKSLCYQLPAVMSKKKNYSNNTIDCTYRRSSFWFKGVWCKC